MRLKNKSDRNVSVLENHSKFGGMPKVVTIIAGSSIELSDNEYKGVLPSLQKLVDAGVLEQIKEEVKSELVVDEPVKTVKTKK